MKKWCGTCNLSGDDPFNRCEKKTKCFVGRRKKCWVAKMKFKRGIIPAKVLRYEDGCPVIACKATWLSHQKSWSLTFICPWCGKKHIHGGGTDKVPSDGHRATHCILRQENGVEDYILEFVEIIGGMEDA